METSDSRFTSIHQPTARDRSPAATSHAPPALPGRAWPHRLWSGGHGGRVVVLSQPDPVRRLAGLEHIRRCAGQTHRTGLAGPIVGRARRLHAELLGAVWRGQPPHARLGLRRTERGGSGGRARDLSVDRAPLAGGRPPAGGLGSLRAAGRLAAAGGALAATLGHPHVVLAGPVGLRRHRAALDSAGAGRGRVLGGMRGSRTPRIRHPPQLPIPREASNLQSPIPNPQSPIPNPPRSVQSPISREASHPPPSSSPAPSSPSPPSPRGCGLPRPTARRPNTPAPSPTGWRRISAAR